MHGETVKDQEPIQLYFTLQENGYFRLIFKITP